MSTPSIFLPLRNPIYRKLFSAQVIALLGTGLTTIALGLLAFDLAEDDAGQVLGVALALKMASYVVVAPLVAAWAESRSRKNLLVGLDVVRALAVVSIAFVNQVWEVYLLIVVLSSASAGFTPAFQAVVPDVFEDVEKYTEALSLSRLAYEFEALLSPALAAALLGVLSYSGLFAANAAAFVCSAILVLTTAIPVAGAGIAKSQRGFARVTSGIRQYLTVPRLRGLFALNLAAASASAMVVVNTVIYVKSDFSLDDSDVAWALGIVGAGSLLVAITLPWVLRRTTDRLLMIRGGLVLALGLVAATLIESFAALLFVWAALGVGLALVQTPAGRLIQRSGNTESRPGLFAAQFSLSHFCWFVTYPVAGFAGAAFGLHITAMILAVLAGASTLLASTLWRSATHLPAQPAGNT